MNTCIYNIYIYMYIIIQVMWPLANLVRVNWGGQPRQREMGLGRARSGMFYSLAGEIHCTCTCTKIEHLLLP